MNVRNLAALALAGAICSTAAHAENAGFYLRIDNGVSSISGAKLKVEGISEKVKFDYDYVVGGAVGYDFDPIALELQYDYTSNSVKDLSQINLKQNTVLANVVYSTKIDETFTTKFGAGLGFQSQSNNLPSATFTNYRVDNLTLNGSLSNKSDTSLAAQLMGSVSAELAPRLSLEAGYKFRYVGESDIYSARGSITSGASTITGNETVKLSSHWAHLFTLGLSYKF
jgi:opacity protein-like surface antigen